MDWIFVDDEMPEEGRYVIGCSGENSPIFITRFIDGEWCTGKNWKRPAFYDFEMIKTSAPVVFWMPLPKAPKEK